jgi:hypothetical protein
MINVQKDKNLINYFFIFSIFLNIFIFFIILFNKKFNTEWANSDHLFYLHEVVPLIKENNFSINKFYWSGNFFFFPEIFTAYLYSFLSEIFNLKDKIYFVFHYTFIFFLTFVSIYILNINFGLNKKNNLSLSSLVVSLVSFFFLFDYHLNYNAVNHFKNVFFGGHYATFVNTILTYALFLFFINNQNSFRFILLILFIFLFSISDKIFLLYFNIPFSLLLILIYRQFNKKIFYLLLLLFSVGCVVFENSFYEYYVKHNIREIWHNSRFEWIYFKNNFFRKLIVFYKINFSFHGILFFFCILSFIIYYKKFFFSFNIFQKKLKDQYFQFIFFLLLSCFLTIFIIFLVNQDLLARYIANYIFFPLILIPFFLLVLFRKYYIKIVVAISIFITVINIFFMTYNFTFSSNFENDFFENNCVIQTLKDHNLKKGISGYWWSRPFEYFINKKFNLDIKMVHMMDELMPYAWYMREDDYSLDNTYDFVIQDFDRNHIPRNDGILKKRILKYNPNANIKICQPFIEIIYDRNNIKIPNF